ncbi:HAMP domain-containing histidine kinase [Actinoplanes sp. TBRC 11911]|uniref:sensor histidine kinase n=1 Tax=Actinoplanes sp. TBRC 11911 TaxID=2729386 RepID=UPI00145D8BBD|nr:HAMP domain-containing sensor histidine kinase [Actinoplanes sp. TBRC 11911]NMO53731.1 HAMP domain-containing histidine kinase [Actinoplanes sp. TBRC 11911]
MSKIARLDGVRLRSALAAAGVVGVAAAVAAVVFVALVRGTLTGNVDSTAEQRADEVTVALRTDDDLEEALRPGIRGAVQVLSTGGDIVASSPAGPNQPVLTALRPAPGEQSWQDQLIPVVGEGRFRVLARGVDTPDGPRIVVVAQSLQPVAEAAEAVTRTLAWGMPGLALVVGVAVFVFVGRSLRPVEQIRRRVATISGQRLHARVPVPATHDEISALAATMNAMLDRLEESAAAQRRFIADASHELRSPLSTVRVGLDHLIRSGSPGGEVRLRRLQAEVSRLGDLVADLLLLARIDENDPVVRRAGVDLDDLAYAERDRLRAVHPGLRIEMRVSPVQVTGDAARLERALRNLGDNAARHARTTVTLSTWADDDGAHVVVGNDGPGIAAADRERVFERFVRLDDSRARADGGAGLGLPITREIVAGHGGQIVIDGDAAFHIRLPLPAGQPSSAVSR